MNPIELTMRRRNVLAFIKADPFRIVLNRAADPVISEAGGRIKGEATTIAPQLVRIVQNVRRYTNGLVNSEAGYIPNTNYLIIAPYYLDVQVDDTFIYGGDHWQITGIHPTREESTLCSIDFYGPKNHG